MSLKSKIQNVRKDPSLICKKFLATKLARIIPDETILKMQFKLNLNKSLSLENPQSFNEKIQWLKLYDRNPLYSTLIDKYDVKEYVAKVIGEEYIIPSLTKAFASFDEIDFSELPEKFVVKCTHDSGGLAISKGKGFDKLKAREIIEKSLKTNFYWRYREWAYSNIRPRVFVETYMENSIGVNAGESLVDYKFFVFNGQAKFLYMSEGLEDHSTASISFFDLEGNILPFKRADFKGFKTMPLMPSNMKQMIAIANKLAQGIGVSFVRVDLYEINGKIYFSELTFYPMAGLIPFDPDEYDLTIGNMLELPKNKRV